MWLLLSMYPENIQSIACSLHIIPSHRFKIRIRRRLSLWWLIALCEQFNNFYERKRMSTKLLFTHLKNRKLVTTTVLYELMAQLLDKYFEQWALISFDRCIVFNIQHATWRHQFSFSQSIARPVYYLNQCNSFNWSTIIGSVYMRLRQFCFFFHLRTQCVVIVVISFVRHKIHKKNYLHSYLDDR